jgi:hypothetical protein
MTVTALEGYGLNQMSDESIHEFLDAQSVGVLGLPAESGPYMVPMSYAYDGERSLYFTYLEGERSRKTELTEVAGTATFVVFSVETMFNWRSVTLQGELVAVPQRHWDDLAELLAGTWRPELFQTGGAALTVEIYRLDVDDWTGIEHTDLAPEFQA